MREETSLDSSVLQDARRDPGEDEELLLAWLGERGVPSLLAVTKLDALAPARRAARPREIGGALGLPEERTLATSAATGAGIDALWRALARFL